MPIEYVDGRRYGRAVVAGSEWVLHTREKLNRINVFPVPDGDTGTNLALSLSATADAVRSLTERDLGIVARTAAEASILGAKGNSGLIFAHWFLGVSRSVAERARVDSRGLAEAMAAATTEVYDAVDRPVEGTVLTVMRVASNCAVAAAGAGRDVQALLDDVIASAETALEKTPEQLPVLAEAGVVDAGALGWVNFMKGVRRALRGEPPPKLSDEDVHGPAAHPLGSVDADLEHRYCTELVCRGTGFDERDLRRRFADDGSHLLVAATERVFKLHVHTNHPERVFAKAERLGTLVERKVDDMGLQHEELVAAERAEAGKPGQPAWPAILVDSTSDLPDEVRREHGIGMVPLQVLFGDRVYRDQVDLSTEEFYETLRRGAIPSTSQPAPRAFVEALDRIRADRDVIVLTIASALSGTFASARSAAALADHPRVEVIDSKSASVGIGLMALGAARLAERGAGLDEIVRWLERWREETTIAFTCDTLDYLRRGGRVNAAQALLGNLLDLRPVLGWDGTEVRAIGRARGERDATRRVLEAATSKLPVRARIRLGLIAAGEPNPLDEAARDLAARYDVIETLRGSFTGVIGAHTGPGTWGIIVQRVRDDDPLV